MFNNHYFFNLIIVGLLLSGAETTIAQPPANSSARSKNAIAPVFFKPPPADQKPIRTAGAGTRGGNCPQDIVPTANTTVLMALVPTTNTGLTVAERPTFLVYLPKTSAKQVVLSIREDGTKHHSQTFFPITGSSGIISFTPPADAPPLELGKTYHWAVVLVCGERPSPNDPAIAAWVRRIAPSQPTNQGTLLQKAAWYGEQGIWYDALDSLAEARHTQSNNNALTGIWTDFLDSAGLEAISTEPLRF